MDREWRNGKNHLVAYGVGGVVGVGVGVVGMLLMELLVLLVVIDKKK